MKKPTVREIIMTTVVNLITWSLVGQVTLVSSDFTSVKNLAGFICGISPFYTKGQKDSMAILSEALVRCLHVVYYLKMTDKKINKAVILAAGFGTRFLPASKAVPKVMFPVIDKPIIQLVVEDIVAAGITDIVIVLSHFTEGIRKHFEDFPVLTELLEKSGKEKEIEELEKIKSMAKFTFVYQRPGRIGNGIALLSAKEAIGNEPFVLSWADEFFIANPSRVTQLIKAYEKFGGMINGCIRTTDPIYGGRFGFYVGDPVDEVTIKVKDLVEKPGVGKAPSEFGSVSGAIIQPEIFDYLEKADKELDPKVELYYNTYGLMPMLKDSYPLYAVEYQNYRYFDTGDRLGYLKALVELGLEYPQFGEEFRKYLREILKD